MTPLEIKFRVYEKWGSITAAAREINCGRSHLSYCIWRKRISTEIKERLAQALGIPLAKLFGESPGEKTPEQDSDSTSGEEIPEQDSDSTSGDETPADGKPIRKKEGR